MSFFVFFYLLVFASIFWEFFCVYILAPLNPDEWGIDFIGIQCSIIVHASSDQLPCLYFNFLRSSILAPWFSSKSIRLSMLFHFSCCWRNFFLEVQRLLISRKSMHFCSLSPSYWFQGGWWYAAYSRIAPNSSIIRYSKFLPFIFNCLYLVCFILHRLLMFLPFVLNVVAELENVFSS